MTNFCATDLSVNSLKRILEGEEIDKVILQVLGYKKVNGTDVDRYRLLLNDGVTVCPFGLLATQLNHLINERKLEKFTVFKLLKYVCTEVKDSKKVILCFDIQPLCPGHKVNKQLSAKQIGAGNQPSTSGYRSLNLKETQDRVESFASSFQVSNISINTQNILRKHGNVLNGVGENISSKQKNNKSEKIIPILNLTPYQNKWTLQARIIYKTPIVIYSNLKNSGKLFSFYLLDDTGEIKVTVFNEQVDKYFEIIKMNEVVLMTNASVKLKASTRNNCIKNDFEITLTGKSQIELVENAADFPKLKFNFKPISEIKKLAKENYVDVVGLCCYASELKSLSSKESTREINKLDLFLIDTNKEHILVSLWGADAKNFTFKDYPVIAIRNARVTDFKGCSLSVSQASMLFINPDIPERQVLKTWFENLGEPLDISSFPSDLITEFKSNSWKTFAQISEHNFEAEQAEYYMVKATIIMVQKEKCLYKACPREDCFKKVEYDNGVYKCIKCNQDYDNFSWTLLLSVNLADETGSLWAVAFRETGESLIGMKTEELSKLMEENEGEFLKRLEGLQFRSFIFKLRSKMEYFNETGRLKTTILDCGPVSEVPYTRKLLEDISKYERALSE